MVIFDCAVFAFFFLSASSVAVSPCAGILHIDIVDSRRRVAREQYRELGKTCEKKLLQIVWGDLKQMLALIMWSELKTD